MNRGHKQQKRRLFRGFTVVELLMVISIIGILVSIALVVYPGYQQRARDAERRSDVTQIAAALNTYALQNNTYIETGSGCGKDGNGNGWLAAGSGVAGYTQSILACLEGADILEAGEFIDPSGCTWGGGSCSANPAKAYMKATCEKNGKAITYVLAYLESEPQKVTEIDDLCTPGTVLGFTSTTQKWGTTSGMNYYVVAK